MDAQEESQSETAEDSLEVWEDWMAWGERGGQ